MNAITPQLLQGLLSPNGNLRSDAERTYQSLSVTDRIPCLLNELSRNHPTDITLLTAVLLRRDIVRLSSSEKLLDLVQPLLQIFKAQQCSQVGHCLAEVCASLTLVQPDAVRAVLTTLLTELHTSCRQGSVPSLQLLAALADKAPLEFSSLAVDSLPTLYSSGWSPNALQAWTQVLVNAATATTATRNGAGGLSTSLNPSNLDDWTIDSNSQAARLAPSVIPILENICWNNSEVHSMSILQNLAQVAICCPPFLAGNPQVLSTLISTCLQVAQTQSINLQLASLDILSSLISVGDVKRRCISSDQATAIATTALPICANIMAATADDNADDDAWAQDPARLLENGMDDEESDDYLFASMLMESFLSNLGALSVVLPCAESLLLDNSRVGLAVLECALAATPVALSQHLPVVLKAATTLADSTNLRTQHQAIRLLGALYETHATDLSSSSQLVLTKLAGALASRCTKVSAMASQALVSICRNAPEATTSYLSDLLTVLIQGPLSWTGTDPGSITVRVRAIGATACLAQASGEAFQEYYSLIQPGLLGTLQAPSMDLAEAALEAATIIGQAVGRDVFQSDAKKLLVWIMPALQNTESTLFEPLLLACARIASVLEEDFAPYAETVVPLLLCRVQEPPDISIAEGDEAGLSGSNEDGTDSMTVAVPGRGFTRVTINTSKIQEKAQAARALYEHAKAMGSVFPYIQQSFDALLPLVNFPYSADVRSCSAQTLGAVFDAACQAGEHNDMELARIYLPLLAEAIATQIAGEDTADMEVLYALADSLSEIYYIAHRYRKINPEILANYNLANARSSVESCMTTLVSCLERRAQITRILEGFLTGDDERQDYIEQLQSEQQLLTPLVDSVGYNLKYFRQEFLSLFEQFIEPVLGPKLKDQSDVRANLSAICLFDDAVEFCGGDAAAKFAPRLMAGIATAFEQHGDEKQLVQAGIYGITQIARYAPSSILSPYLQIIIPRLLALTSRPKTEAGDDLFLIEIAASALASMTLLGPFQDVKFVSRDLLVNSFLSQLPILQDDDEAKINHAGLCHLIENGIISLEKDTVRITRIIAEILMEVEEGEDVATPDTLERMSNILFQMQQSLPPPTMRHALEALGPDAQMIVASAIEECSHRQAQVITP